MLILAAFAVIALLTAGGIAVIKGDTFTFVSLLIVLGLLIIIGTPIVRDLQTQLRHAIETAHVLH